MLLGKFNGQGLGCDQELLLRVTKGKANVCSFCLGKHGALKHFYRSSSLHDKPGAGVEIIRCDNHDKCKGDSAGNGYVYFIHNGNGIINY